MTVVVVVAATMPETPVSNGEEIVTATILETVRANQMIAKTKPERATKQDANALRKA
jgi:hypothetical protein